MNACDIDKNLKVLVDLATLSKFVLPYYIAVGLSKKKKTEHDGELRMLRVLRLLTLDKYLPSVSLIGRIFFEFSGVFDILTVNC